LEAGILVISLYLQRWSRSKLNFGILGYIDQRLKLIFKNDLLFGGISLLLLGDFR